jgi:hypothetical protein
VELHGICGNFYHEESIKFQNICALCKLVLDRKERFIELHGFPPLPIPMMPEDVAELLPEISITCGPEKKISSVSCVKKGSW